MARLTVTGTSCHTGTSSLQVESSSFGDFDSASWPPEPPGTWAGRSRAVSHVGVILANKNAFPKKWPGAGAKAPGRPGPCLAGAVLSATSLALRQSSPVCTSAPTLAGPTRTATLPVLPSRCLGIVRDALHTRAAGIQVWSGLVIEYDQLSTGLPRAGRGPAGVGIIVGPGSIESIEGFNLKFMARVRQHQAAAAPRPAVSVPEGGPSQRSCQSSEGPGARAQKGPSRAGRVTRAVSESDWV
jgi:hypothetical protein